MAQKFGQINLRLDYDSVGLPGGHHHHQTHLDENINVEKSFYIFDWTITADNGTRSETEEERI